MAETVWIAVSSEGREAAGRHVGRTLVGTVVGEEEADIVRAIDRYASGHTVADRSAVVREVLSQRWRIGIRRQYSSRS